jgi:hypothetical protein
MSASPRTTAPFVLLGLMTVASFGGPFLIFVTIQGGERPGWPPDRPIEWWMFGLITGLVAVLMIACLALGLVRGREVVAQQGPEPPAGSKRVDAR